MIYQLTEKGKKMWPEGEELRLYSGGSGFSIYIQIQKEHIKTLAYGPLEVEALIRLGLIEETNGSN